MVSHHVVSQLVLFALIWLVIILHFIWSKPGVSTPVTPAEPEPLTPKRQRSNVPQPFEGLTQKPQCALCERDLASPKPPVIRKNYGNDVLPEANYAIVGRRCYSVREYLRVDKL